MRSVGRRSARDRSFLLEYLFQILDVRSEIFLHVPHLVLVAGTFNHEPSAPPHLVEGLLDGRHVERRIIGDGESIGIGGVYLSYAVLAESAQLLYYIAVVI